MHPLFLEMKKSNLERNNSQILDVSILKVTVSTVYHGLMGIWTFDENIKDYPFNPFFNHEKVFPRSKLDLCREIELIGRQVRTASNLIDSQTKVATGTGTRKHTLQIKSIYEVGKHGLSHHIFTPQLQPPPPPGIW